MSKMEPVKLAVNVVYKMIAVLFKNTFLYVLKIPEIKHPVDLVITIRKTDKVLRCFHL